MKTLPSADEAATGVNTASMSARQCAAVSSRMVNCQPQAADVNGPAKFSGIELPAPVFAVVWVMVTLPPPSVASPNE
jgi:hypothetical protein